MPCATILAPSRRPGVLGLALMFLCGCRAPTPSDSEVEGVRLNLPTSWSQVPKSTFPVPGTPLSAWKGPAGASLVVFRTLPAPGRTAKGLAEELANRMTNLPGVRVEVRRVERLAGREVARVEVVAPGVGDALAPSGQGVPVAPAGKALVPTRRVTFGIPGAGPIRWLTWHFPESSRARVAPRVDAAVASLRWEDGTSSSY